MLRSWHQIVVIYLLKSVASFFLNLTFYVESRKWYNYILPICWSEEMFRPQHSHSMIKFWIISNCYAGHKIPLTIWKSFVFFRLKEGVLGAALPDKLGFSKLTWLSIHQKGIGAYLIFIPKVFVWCAHTVINVQSVHTANNVPNVDTLNNVLMSTMERMS